MSIDYSLVPADIQSESQNTLEKAKFTNEDDGKVRVRVTSKGTVAPSGLSTAGKVTTFEVNTSATLFPVLSGRTAISVLNTSGSETLYLGFENTVTADTVVGTTSGWEIGPNEIYHTDITEDIDIYGIVASGTVLVKLLEVA